MLMRANNADIANVDARAENITFMTLSLIYRCFCLVTCLRGSRREDLQVRVAVHPSL
jgi:hypothetical protein